MPRRFEFHAMVGDGPSALRVGYSSKRRGKFYAVVFNDPDGHRVQKATQCRKVDIAFETEAARLIATAYRKVYPSTATTKKVTWDDALNEVKMHPGKARPKTLVAFERAQQTLRELLDGAGIETQGPGDITRELAFRFWRLLESTPYKRGNAGVERMRTAVTLDYYRRSLSALWGKYAEGDRGYVAENVWSAIKPPEKEEAEPEVPTEGEVAQFLGWVSTRYPEWHRLHALLNLKLLSACRTADIVQLKSEQVKDGKLTFKPEQVKTRKGRSVPLPDDLYQQLRGVAGQVWLWEGWHDDCLKYRSSPNNRKLTGGFDPETVQGVLENIFREYSDSHPDRRRISPHKFRGYGITTMATVTGSVDLTAQALGVNAQTARKYYLNAARAFDAADAFKVATEKMLPKPATPGEEKPKDVPKDAQAGG